MARGLRSPVEHAWPITRKGKWLTGSRDGVGGGRSTDDLADNITVGEGRAPTSSVQMVTRRSHGECPDRAGSTSDAPAAAEGGPMKARALRTSQELDKARALQHVLYRSAKQDPKRRFHARNPALRHPCACQAVNYVGKPCAGEPHARFERGALETERDGPRRQPIAAGKDARVEPQPYRPYNTPPCQRPTSPPEAVH